MDFFEYDSITKYDIQGFIYSLLKNSTNFNTWHDIKGFKFFNFSNIFPISNFHKNTIKTLIISSPIDSFIENIYNSLKKIDFFYLSNHKMEIENIKIIKPKNFKKFQSSTPVVLFEDNLNNRYYSFKQNPDFDFFFNRLKDNAIKKYNAFSGANFEMDLELFNTFEFVKEVSIRVKKNSNSFIIIGSLWNNLEFELDKNNKDFYRFLLDAGLGEKNSLGFGMLNDIM